ncbi:fumarate hydratase [Shigella flexneri]
MKVAPEDVNSVGAPGVHDASFMLVRRTDDRWPTFCVTRRPAKMMNLWRCNSCVTPTSRRKAFCQPVGYRHAIIVGKKGQRVWTGGGDEAALARGVYNTYIEDNLRSRNAPLDMYKKTKYRHRSASADGCSAVDGDDTNSSVSPKVVVRQTDVSYQETEALLTRGNSKIPWSKMRTLGTAACPPYHIAFVIGGTLAETNLKTVKLVAGIL